MQPVSTRILRADFNSLIVPRLTIWRPVYEGKVQPVKIIPPNPELRNDIIHSHVTVIPYSDNNRIREPSVTYYLGAQRNRGVICFLTDKKGQPCHELPENWFGLEVTHKYRKCMRARILTADLKDYLNFRAEVAENYADPSMEFIDYEPVSHLIRLRVDPVLNQANFIDYRYDIP